MRVEQRDLHFDRLRGHDIRKEQVGGRRGPPHAKDDCQDGVIANAISDVSTERSTLAGTKPSYSREKGLKKDAQCATFASLQTRRIAKPTR